LALYKSFTYLLTYLTDLIWKMKEKADAVYAVCCVMSLIRYGDGAGNTVEHNASIFSLIRMR